MGVAVGVEGLGGLGTHGSVVDGDLSNRDWSQRAFLELSAIMCSIEVEFDTFAGSLPRLTSLHMTGVPGFYQMTPRTTPTTFVFPKSYASLSSMIANCLSVGIGPTAYPPTALLTYPSVEMSSLLK